jgi:hypothetical protein
MLEKYRNILFNEDGEEEQSMEEDEIIDFLNKR